MEGNNSATVKIDGTAPVTTAAGLQASPTTGWTNGQTGYCVFTTTDATSGFKRLDGSIDVSGSFSFGVSGGTVSTTTPGSHPITFYATDVAGNVEATKSGYLNYDPTAPRADAQISAPAAPGASGWYTSGPVTLVVSGSDAVSGVALRQYRVAGAASWTTYTGPVALPQGTTTYEYRVLDAAGNTSTIGTIGASVDTQAPTTTAPVGAPASWTNVAPTITLRADDGGSGPALTQYRQQGAADWTTYTTPFQVTTQGQSAWEYRSVDVAGNTETPQALDVKLDSQAPATTAFAAKARVRKAVALKYQVNDPSPGSGSATAVIRIYKGKKLKKTLRPVVCTTNLKASYRWKCSLAAGRYTLKVSATDAAGNVQSRVGSARLTVR
jgi:hypothetical protein